MLHKFWHENMIGCVDVDMQKRIDVDMQKRKVEISYFHPISNDHSELNSWMRPIGFESFMSHLSVDFEIKS